MDGWPSSIQPNIFGSENYFYGDTDGDDVLDLLPPNSLAPNFVNMFAPPKPHLSWALIIDDATMTRSLQPRSHLSSVPSFVVSSSSSLAHCCSRRLRFHAIPYGVLVNKFGVVSLRWLWHSRDRTGLQSMYRTSSFKEGLSLNLTIASLLHAPLMSSSLGR